MKFLLKRDVLLKSLNLVQGIIEKKNTLPILSNVLLEAKKGKLSIIATDLDLIFYDEINEIKIITEGKTTTSAAVLYDILRKISGNSDINFDLKTENKLSLNADNSDFNLLCLPTDNFPNFADNFDENQVSFNKSSFLSLLNKTKVSISNDDTRHYLNGVYMHLTEAQGRNFLTGVATDSHRLSSSSLEIDKINDFSSLILPRKTVYQLCSILSENSEPILMQVSDNKIKFTIGNIKLISKVIDGRFPDYSKVIPKNNEKVLQVELNKFKNSIERVITVSSDRKEGLKMTISKDSLKLSVNSPNSGEGVENIDPEENTTYFCQWLLEIFPSGCAEDCDQETLDEIEEYMIFCDECLAENNCDEENDDILEPATSIDGQTNEVVEEIKSREETLNETQRVSFKNSLIEGSINLTPSNSNLLENFFCFPEQLTYISPCPSKKASLHTSIILNLKFSSFFKTSPRSIKTLKFKCFCFEVNKDSIV